MELSFINLKLFETETNRLLFLCQEDVFSQSALVKELQTKLEEQVRLFIQETCCYFAATLLSKYRQNLAKNNLSLNYRKSSQLTNQYQLLAFEFEKLLVKLSKEYSAGSKKTKEQYLFSKLETIIDFYNDLQSIVNEQGKLPAAKKDILSLGVIEKFKKLVQQ